MLLRPPAPKSTDAQRSNDIKVNKANMAVPWRLEAFQSAMWRFESPTHLPICEHASSLASYIAEQAMLAFGPARDRPRQPWISPATWDVVKTITPVRRRSYRACAAAAKTRMRMAITVWAASCTQAFRAPGRDAHPLPRTNLGWAAVARMQELRRLWLAWSREAAVTWRACAIIQHAIRPCVDADRITYIELKAAEGQAAARRGDWRETFAVVRALSGKSSKRCTQQVRKLDGELTATEQERQQRWHEHFTGVFDGTVVDKAVLARQRIGEPTPVTVLLITPESTAAALRRLGRNKGTGPDGVPSEVLQAGGDALAVKTADAYCRVALHERWPVAWSGGRIVEVHKNKGPADICDESRGITLEDHLAKGLKELLAPHVTPAYTEAMPPGQYGATAGRGAGAPLQQRRMHGRTCASQG